MSIANAEKGMTKNAPDQHPILDSGAYAPPPPTFTLTATDAMAPFALRHWARISRAGRVTPAHKIADAERVAEAMEEWLASVGAGEVQRLAT